MSEEVAAASPAELGKREFVRALSVDENDHGGGGGGAAVVVASDAASAASAAAAAAAAVPTQDLRFQRHNPDIHPAGWWAPDATHLSVRDVNYLDDKKKAKSEPSVFDCVEVECFQVPKSVRKVEHVASQPFSVFHRLRKKAPKGTPYLGAPGSGFTFIINFQAPGYGVAMYFQRKAGEKVGDEGGGKAFELALRCFLEGDEEYRTQHLKFFPIVTEGGWIVRKVVGGKPAIIAKKIDCQFFDGDNYFEADIDVSSSSVAKNILRVVKSYAKKIAFDLGWGFEGKVVEHLPERILGIARFEHVHVNLLPVVGGGSGEDGEVDEDPE